MNLMFWKKKIATDESDNRAADEIIIAEGTDPTPAKPSFWTRLKSTLSPSHKKSKPDEEYEVEPSVRRKNDKHQDEEPETPPPKPGFLTRLKSALMPSRKKDKAEDEEEPEERKPSAKRTDKEHRAEEPEPSDVPAVKPRNRLVIVLLLLIPLAAAGGFFAAIKLLPPPQHQEAPTAKNAALQEVKTDGQPAPEPTEAAEQTPPPQPAQSTEPAPQQADNATAPAAEVPAPSAEANVADAPAPTDADVQAQIEAMKKQHQEMQAQIEALKKQPATARPERPSASATPREGVLIINGKNTKESVQGLKKVIEGMNAPSGAKESEKK